MLLIDFFVKIVNPSLPFNIIYSNYRKKFNSIVKYSVKIYVIFLAVSFIWTSAIIITPVLAGMDGFWSELSVYLYTFFSSTCHQLEERSFFISGFPMAVCSRCASIYAAFLLSVILYPFIRGLENTKLPPLWILLLFSVLILLDAVLDISGTLKNTFLTRGVSGFLVGFILPFYLIPGTLNFANEIRNKYLKL